MPHDSLGPACGHAPPPPPLLGARAGPIANSCLAPEEELQAPGGIAVQGPGQCGRRATWGVLGERQGPAPYLPLYPRKAGEWGADG